MSEMNAGIFELAGEAVGRELTDPAAFRAYHERLRDLAVETGRPVTFGNFSRLEAREVWRRYDPDTIAPEMPEVANDLPAGARRLVQRARGIAATVVNGEVLLRDGKHTGALPGRLLRGPLARRP
jgi:hypothetical protein